MASYKLIVKNAKVILKTVTNAVLNITGIRDLLTGTGAVDSNTKIDWTLQHYTNTAANFTSTNPILLVGQLGIETDDLLTAPKYKIGDGVTDWATLPYNSSGATGNFVPYTGANSDVDLGNYMLNAKSLHAKGTGGAGHLGLKHQSANITASASESSLGANSSGNPVWKNDGNAIELLELQTNKTSTVTGNETSTSLYLTVKGVYDWATGLFAKRSTLTTNTIPKATASDTIGDSNITDDGTNVVVNGLRIRSISNATYFNASGVNGHYWNSFNDAINLFRVKNDGVVNIPQGTSDRIMALDTNKDIVYLSTIIYPSLTELSYVKGLTSAIQTQLDAKAGNLLAKINVNIAHTGTTTETILNSSTPILGFTANDFVKFIAKLNATNNANGKTFRIYVNTSHSLSGATLLATLLYAGSAQTGIPFKRTMWFKNSLTAQGIYAVSSSLINDENAVWAGGEQNLTYDFSGTNYIIISGQLANSTDTMTLNHFSAKIER